MSYEQLFFGSMSVMGGLLGLLIIVFGWLGNKIYERIDALVLSVGRVDRELRVELQTLERDLRENVAEVDGRVSHLYSRVSVLEARSREDRGGSRR